METTTSDAAVVLKPEIRKPDYAQIMQEAQETVGSLRKGEVLYRQGEYYIVDTDSPQGLRPVVPNLLHEGQLGSKNY